MKDYLRTTAASLVVSTIICGVLWFLYWLSPWVMWAAIVTMFLVGLLQSWRQDRKKRVRS